MDAESTADPVRLLAERLRRLQQDAGGPSVRDLVRLTARVGAPYTRGTLQDKLSGRSTPTWEFVEAFVRACALHGGAGEPDLRPWREAHGTMTRELAAQRAGRRRAVRSDLCPYRGLEAFGTEHSQWFHGRSAAIQDVLAALTTYRKGSLILGPSGAGKTSLVQAGVLPALAAGELPGSDRWVPMVVRPGKNLAAELGRTGLPGHLPDAVASRLAAEPSGTRLLLIVDQFEEALTPPASMNGDTARLAEAVGLSCEEGLAERIITDALGAEYEATRIRRAPITVLPLLELTLRQLWQRRRDDHLTHDAYQRVGGVAGAVATWCDTAVEQLPAAQRPTARRILTALVRPADETRRVPAVRQQVPLTDLRDLVEDDDNVDDVLGVLIDHRIVTTRTTEGVPVAELVHEALIREWTVLREWVEQDHRFQDWLRRANERQASWSQRRDPDDLLHGTELAEGLDWSQQRRLPRLLAEFLTASQHSQRTAIRRVRGLNVILAALLAVAVSAAGLALWQRQAAVDAQRTALSRQLAAQSGALLKVDPDQASALAVRAYRTSPTAEATGALYAAAASPLISRLPDSVAGDSPLAFSPDGRTLATMTDRHAVRLWDLPTGTVRATLPERGSRAWSLAFSPDGGLLASAHEHGAAYLWDVAGRRTRATLTGGNEAQFSRDGRKVVTAGDDGVARIWDTVDGADGAVLDGHAGAVYCAEFAPDGRTVITAGEDGMARLWSLPGSRVLDDLTGCAGFAPDGRTVALMGDGTARLRQVSDGRVRSTIQDVAYLAYSPDGRTLALGGLDGAVRLWDTTTRRTRLTLPGTGVQSLAFSADSRVLATTTAAAAGSTESVVRLWDTTAGQPTTTYTGHTEAVNAVAFSPDGRTLVTGGDDRTLRLWDVADGRGTILFEDPNGAVRAVAVSPDGRIVVTASNDDTVALWDTTAAIERPRRTIPTQSDVKAVAFSPDGRLLAAASSDDTVRLWDAATGRPRMTLVGHTGDVRAVAFAPDGKTLATAGDDDTARLWDLATGQPRAVLTGHARDVRAVVFRPDGRMLATASDDHTVKLWSVEPLTPASAMEKLCRDGADACPP